MKLLARYWFPLALIALLVLALPGFGLFGLNLWGLQGPVNQWLEHAYQLSYSLPLPWWGALPLLLVPLAIVLLYFLKLKRKPLRVPSTFLWRKSVEDLHVNSLLQWLRQNVLLLLQLLAVLAMIYGIMGFRFHGNTAEGKHYIIMLDSSASMAATDVAPSRLEWAKQEALKEIDACTDDDVGMVIVFNSAAEIRQSYTANRNLLREAVRRVEQTQRPTRIEEALALADSQANPARATVEGAGGSVRIAQGKALAEGVAAEVHLFSDGRFPAVPEFSLGNLNLHYHAAGKLVTDAGSGSQPALKPAPESADNVALITFNALRDEQDATKLQAFVGALNYRAEEVRARVQLEVSVNGALKGVYERPLRLAARKIVTEADAAKDEAGPRDIPGEASAAFDLADIDDRTSTVLHARLLDVDDKLALDNEAWLVVGVPRKARVLIAGPPNEVLDKFFDADEVRLVADVEHLAPADLAKDAYRKPALAGAYDLVVFDRCGPATEQDMPRANTFFIGYPPPPWKRDALEAVSGPHITGWMPKSPILRDLAALYTLEIDQAFRLTDLPQRTPKLIEARKIDKERNTELPLLIALTRNSFTDLVMAFPILTDKGEWNTTWPLQASFPLFLRNVLYSLGNLSESAAEDSVQPGQVKTVRPDAGVRRVEVAGPDGTTQALVREDRDPRTDFTFGGTDRVGVYRVSWEGQARRLFAVNLLDPEESNIEPRPVVQIGSERVAAGQERSQPRDLWKWFALAALAVLMLEWYVYNRRVYI